MQPWIWIRMNLKSLKWSQLFPEAAKVTQRPNKLKIFSQDRQDGKTKEKKQLKNL